MSIDATNATTWELCFRSVNQLNKESILSSLSEYLAYLKRELTEMSVDFIMEDDGARVMVGNAAVVQCVIRDVSTRMAGIELKSIEFSTDFGMSMEGLSARVGMEAVLGEYDSEVKFKLLRD